MSTRSIIAIKDGRSKYRAIYCHWDGYPEGVGAMLKLHYSSNEKAESLLKLGSISSLNEKLEPVGHHTFDEPEDGVTVAYHRDRGEEYCGPVEGSSIKKLKERYFNWTEYAHVWDGKKWRTRALS